MISLYIIFFDVSKVGGSATVLATNALKEVTRAELDAETDKAVGKKKTSVLGTIFKGLVATAAIGGVGYLAYKLSTDWLSKPAQNVTIPGNYTAGNYMNQFAARNCYPLPGCCNGYNMMMGCRPMCPPNIFPLNSQGLYAGSRSGSYDAIMWDAQVLFGGGAYTFGRPGYPWL